MGKLIEELFVATLTRPERHAGTRSPIVLVANWSNIDRVYWTIASGNRYKGQASIQSRLLVQTEQLSADPVERDIYYRVEVRGNDQWAPEHIFVWGRVAMNAPAVPLAMGTALDVKISTDRGEGPMSFPLHRVYRGGDPEIRRLLILVKTADRDDAETSDDITLRMVTRAGALVVDYRLPNTPQIDRGRDGANMYFVDPIAPFRKSELDGSLIRLQTSGDNAWLPSSFFVFGLDRADSVPSYVVPLVHLDLWSLGNLSTDSSEGDAEVHLPLAR
jgi:hypothetical protein